MNRAHTGIQAEQAIRLAHDLGVKAMTLDLIYGVPTSGIGTTTSPAPRPFPSST